MSGLEDLRHHLSGVRAGLDEAREHTEWAGGLLEQSRRVLVDVQAQAEPWLPAQLPHAIDQIAAHGARLASAGELLERYEATL